ncbi:CD48 antigen [Anabarilius grahami]|uniref:CD48 antigen n=1 Tax=Anabarilius grahami TaxID=495550 RepID=A0A3N0YCS6_ANAGA|nr:CD48 antigen [Anabarilius grahami]
MAFGHLFMIFMTMLIFNTASMYNAENPVSVQTGSSVQLDIQTDKLPEFQTLVWMSDKSKNIVTFINKETKILKDNVVFNQTTFSLTLKNLQKTDSGLYTAKIFVPNEEVAKYRVSVIDPVDSPVLNWNITKISVNSCIVNVTCSSPERTISNSYHSNCSQEEVTSTEMQPLTVYCKEDIVICNYSNTVSWRNDTVQIKQLCTTHESAQEENDHTIYAQVQPKNTLQRPLEMLEKTANPQTVYELTEEMPEPEISAQMQTNNPVCTTYSTIGQHQKPLFATEDHTVYSKVCKSPRGRPHVH